MRKSTQVRHIDKTAKLLAKASATDSDLEAIALLWKCPSLLRDLVDTLEDQLCGDNPDRSSERRPIFDRRRSRIPAGLLVDTSHVEDPALALAHHQGATDADRSAGAIVDRSV